MIQHKFYDTSSLLLCDKTLFQEEGVVISNVSLRELEDIKTSARKTEEQRACGRRLTRLLDEHIGEYQVVNYVLGMDDIIDHWGLPPSNDAKILACYWLWSKQYPDTILYTNDICFKNLARNLMPNANIQSVEPEPPEDYKGYRELYLTESEVEYFYSHLTENSLNLLTNEYALLYDADAKVLFDKVCWTGEDNRTLTYSTLDSQYFGKTKPLKGDPYQALAMDSFKNNKITMIKGPAGTGKSWLSLAFLFDRLEKRKIDKIIIFCNTVATKDSAKLGYYPGSREEKLLDSQIGNFLSSKLNGKENVEKLIADGKLLLLPMSDIRGYDTSNLRAGVYITEAQNLSIPLMKLALQRIGEDSICIIDGDHKTQVDDESYEGNNNGMVRVSEVFRGSEVYGEVELKNVYRSRIASIAEKM